MKMARLSETHVTFSKNVPDALVAYLISAYKADSRNKLGRTILQKLCYFAEASGVPLPFRFEIYHYGPFSQEIFDSTDRLALDEVIEDASSDRAQSDFVPGPRLSALLTHFDAEINPYKKKLTRVVRMFSDLSPSQMELISTIHYMHSSHREWFNKAPKKRAVVSSVLEVKGHKFGKATIAEVYDVLEKAGMLS